MFMIQLTWSNDRWEVVSRARRACSGAFYRRSCVRRLREDCWGRHGRSGNDIVSRPTVHHINPPCYIPRSGPRTPVTPSRCSAQTSTRVINKAIDARSPFAEIQLFHQSVPEWRFYHFVYFVSLIGDTRRKYSESRSHWIKQLTDIVPRKSRRY